MDLSVVIPTLNEEKAIGHIVDECRAVLESLELESEIIVVDGDSQDRTREIAQKKGATIMVEKRRGKGTAVKTAFQRLNSTYVVMLDGDYTYDPGDIPKLLEPLQQNEADFVLGHRHYQKGSMTWLNHVGNRFITLLVRVLYRIPVNDVCTGYWAFKKSVVDVLDDVDAAGFELEAIMLITAYCSGFRMVEVPVGYRPRKGKAKLHPVKSGFTIVRAVIQMLQDYHPVRRGL